MKKEKHYLIKYHHVTGEYEMGSHTTLVVPKGTNVESCIHLYFMEYWGDSVECDDKAKRYYYFNGEIAVEVDGWREITKAQYETLMDVGLT